MRIAGIVLLFVVAFVLAWILIFTFSQQPFTEAVPARIFNYTSPSLPVYYFVIISFLLGLLIGLLIAVANTFGSASKRSVLKKKIRDLEVAKEKADKDLELAKQENVSLRSQISEPPHSQNGPENKSI